MGPEKTYAEREKLGRGRWMPSNGSKLARVRNFLGRINRKTRIRLLGILALIVMIILFYVTRKHCYEQSPFRKTANRTQHCITIGAGRNSLEVARSMLSFLLQIRVVV